MTTEVLPIAPGCSVVLIDGRGCWRLHVIGKFDLIGTDAFWLDGVTWRRIKFERTDERDGAGRPILRSRQPAIGPKRTPFLLMYLPDGWSAPTKANA